MKRIIIASFVLTYIFILSGCNLGVKPITVETEFVKGLFISTYNFDEQNTTHNWVYRDADMKGFLKFFSNLKGKKVEDIDYRNIKGPLYGIELNSSEVNFEYKYLLAGDYLITYEKEVYLIDGDSLATQCRMIVRDTRIIDGLDSIINHRALSLMDGEWKPDFMYKAGLNLYEGDEVVMTGRTNTIESNAEYIHFAIANGSEQTIEFGDRVILETQIENEWYMVEDMFNENINYAWNSILHIIEPDISVSYKHYLKFYNPIPSGRYRLMKEISNSEREELGYLSFEFLVE